MATYHSRPTIDYSTAAQAVEIALHAGRDSGVLAVVTVVDTALLPVAFGRADGSTPHGIETSRRKATSSASTRKPTAAMDPAMALALEHGSGGLLSCIKGGVPLAFDGMHVGGLGVAGGTPDQDAEIAAATLAALGADRTGAVR